MKSLEQYLRDNHSRNVIDHALRANVDGNGVVSFYIHPANADGDTLDFVPHGNALHLIQDEPQTEEWQRIEKASYVDSLLQTLRDIKKTALTASDGPAALAHIVRLCINAGIGKKLPQLMEENL